MKKTIEIDTEELTKLIQRAVDDAYDVGFAVAHPACTVEDVQNFSRKSLASIRELVTMLQLEPVQPLR